MLSEKRTVRPPASCAQGLFYLENMYCRIDSTCMDHDPPSQIGVGTKVTLPPPKDQRPIDKRGGDGSRVWGLHYSISGLGSGV